MATVISQRLVDSDTTLSLSRLAIGRTARVTHVDPRAHGFHLMEMGVTPGALVRVVRAAPFGDPIDIVVRGYHLSLRRREADSVTVTLEQGEGPLR